MTCSWAIAIMSFCSVASPKMMVSWQASGSQVATRISFPVSRKRVRWNWGIERGDAEAVALDGGDLELGADRVERRQDLRVFQAGLAQHEGRKRLQRQPDLEDLAQPVGADFYQAHAAIGHADDDALALEQAEGLADRHAADVQAAGDVGLDDPVARHEHSGRAACTMASTT